MPEHKPETVYVPLNLLTVDPRVQRRGDERKAASIADTLNLDAIGLICVSHRGDGSYSIIDGQHRVMALRLAGFNDELVDCEVYRGLTIEEEAAMFRLRNNRTGVQKIDLFRVRVIEREPVAIAIHDMLTRHGWAVGMSKNNGTVAAVEALERAWNLDPNGNPPAAERVIVTITAAWGHSAAGADRAIISGLSLLYARYGGGIDSGDVIDRLTRYPGGANSLVGEARGLSRNLGITVQSAVAEIVVGQYNKRRKTRALPPWRA